MVLEQGMVEAIHHRGKEVHAWTVDTVEDATKMIEVGVDNIITDGTMLSRIDAMKAGREK